MALPAQPLPYDLQQAVNQAGQKPVSFINLLKMKHHC